MISLVRNICTIILAVATAQHVSYAQTLYTRDAKITVAPSTTLTINGSVENKGTIANDGHIKVAGPWVNSGTYEAGEGEVTFNSSSGTLPQIIHHNGQTFNTITISGGTRKVLLSDLVISREIRFDRGVVENAGDAKIIFGPGAAITGASDSSHVHGIVFQQGSGRKLFPIGNGLTYLPVELSDVKDASAIIGVQALEFGSAALSLSPALKAISQERYWHIDITSGTLPNSPIVLPLRDASWTDDPEEIVVVQSESMTENFTNIGRAVYQGSHENGSIRSELNVSMPFVALAAAAKESELEVFNAVSNNGDDRNDFVRIENIENYPKNRFSVFSRWGDLVFEIENYDNSQNVFRGYSNINNDKRLLTGTYFYVLEVPGHESLRGFISVKN